MLYCAHAPMMISTGCDARMRKSAGREAIASRLEQWTRRVGEALDMFISRRVQALEQCLLHELKSYEDAEQTGRSIHAAEKDIEIISGLRAKLAPTLLKARQLKAAQ